MKIVEEVPVFTIFQHNVNQFILLENSVEFNDIWVSKASVDKYLSPEILHIRLGNFSIHFYLVK